MIIFDLDYCQTFSNKTPILGGVQYSFTDSDTLMNSAGEIVSQGDVSASAMAFGRDSRASGYGFTMTQILPDGSSQSSSSANSSASSGDK